VDAFIDASRIAPGSLEHLYPEVKGPTRIHGVADRSAGATADRPLAAEG